ncbi:WPP domain-associated protein-like [Pyrus communis]|uniref:WPP domain-associated protein-like n=1 Tax=Pyrus communis TaxID=23211 RepID=UPI0035C1B9C5
MERLELLISESLGSLKDRLELLISENRHLRDLLANKEREVQCLSLQVSEAAEKMSEHSMAEAKLLKTTANLKSAVEDADIEALFVEDAYACILRGMMDQINCIVETVFQQVEEMVSSANASVCERQQEQDFKADIEAPVMRNCIWSNRDRFYGNKNLNWHGRMEEISSLREELDIISKSLLREEVDEESNNHKKGDSSHHKVLNNLKSSPSLSLMSSSTSTSTSSSLWEVDVNRLTHMSTDELKSYMTKLERSHESEVLGLTEQIFSLRREFFREGGSSLPSKKSKEFDMLRGRISEVITKLDEVLVEKEEVATCGNKEESLSGLKERLEFTHFRKPPPQRFACK